MRRNNGNNTKNMDNENTADNRSAGNAAEDMAVKWIEKNKGYAILARNYRCPAGEIDIIAADGDTTVFIEVKYRSTDTSGYPSEAVTVRKQERIIKTAMAYISDKPQGGIRFDVAEILAKNGRKYIRYMENAFEWRSCPWH